MTISSRERKFVVAGGVVLVAFLAINYAVVPAISSQFQVQSEYRERVQALERFQLVVEGKRRYEKKFAEAEALFTQLQQRLLSGEKLTLAAADLQAMLHKAAGESGVTIVSESIHAPKKTEGFTQVAVELLLNADLRKLRDFLYKIETAGKLLTVPKLHVNASFPRPGAELQVTVVVSGYTMGLEEKSPGA
ncbi:General secretion pathway protein M [Candidatus Methylomirabilis lanthanidiphila]|uniref:General secretion pathway protein M n=1 Tax=Candidatus Methylomirabilis lanthanidiphila TaxID=2211376 RepID=A0A564ZJM4_9BACT|nr:type II secretion system protein M [Candidatus Methylomirabilis lanthanidiphila]VUZ85525.1 General secretion pathway protein M [Candidatus Methylomirabilis lanthanidiphila]